MVDERRNGETIPKKKKKEEKRLRKLNKNAPKVVEDEEEKGE